MDESRREELWEWNWFVAVWGRKPEGAVVASEPHRDEDDGDTTDDGDDEDEDGRHRWWAFWQPQDIRNLSQWLAHHHGLDHVEDDERNPQGKGKIERHNKTSNGHLIPPNRPSVTSSTADTFSDRASTVDAHGIMEVDEDHETDDAPREASPLTDFDESDDESGNRKLLDSPPNGRPSQRAMKELVTSLGGYARILEWRIQRGERERKARQKD